MHNPIFSFKALGSLDSEQHEDSWAGGPALRIKMHDEWTPSITFYELLAAFLELGLSAQKIQAMCEGSVQLFVQQNLRHEPASISSWERKFVDFLAKQEGTSPLGGQLCVFRKMLKASDEFLKNKVPELRAEAFCDGSVCDPALDRFFEKFSVAELECLGGASVLAFRDKQIKKVAGIRARGRKKIAALRELRAKTK